MKRCFIILIVLLPIIFTGCSPKAVRTEKTEKQCAVENSAVQRIDENMRTPMAAQWTGELDYNPYNTIYYKTYYDDFVSGRIMYIRHPDVNLKENLEDYFDIDDSIVEGMYTLVDMFFDSRTIEMEEEELKSFFYSQGYYLYTHNADMDNLHIRLVEIQEKDGLSIYPSRILIQTWDEEHIYLEDITGPIPRKIRNFLTVDNKEEPQMIIHSSGLSGDYIWEEELSFWTFKGSYWALTPMDLDIDTSHAHNRGDLYPDLDRDKLFPATFYRDGIAYRPSIQGDGVGSRFTYRLGKMEEIEKNKRFRLVGIFENIGKTEEDSNCYIEFSIR